MDTRLKNNKTALRAAAVVIVIAASCFALFALQCRSKVKSYYAAHDSDFEGGDFIKVLFQWSYVLYPEVLEKS